jgi:hypothetical protein
MDVIPLHIIAAFYTLLCAVALTSGVFIVLSLRRQGKSPSWLDRTLFVAWAFGLAGGIGVLLKQSWGLYVLELFCLALVVFLCYSMWQRYKELKKLSQHTEVNWLGAFAGLTLVSVPIVFICYATVASLRSEAARAALGY